MFYPWKENLQARLGAIPSSGSLYQVLYLPLTESKLLKDDQQLVWLYRKQNDIEFTKIN